MSGHLLLIAIGPVQEFIAQARRTRDLWYGSHLLSELSRKVAASLAEAGAELIFPALRKDDVELENCLEPLRAGKPPLNVANKILAELRDGLDPQALATSARNAVKEYWRCDIAARVKQDYAGLLAPSVQVPNIDRVWEEQIDSLLEFAAAWAPLGAYKNARDEVEQAIAGRKNLREFAAWEHKRDGAPKSSLDGARDSVLADERDADLAHRFRIAANEQLDAVSLVKRAGGKPEQFVPIVNVALASWIDLASRPPEPGLTSSTVARLADLREASKALGVARVMRDDLPCTRAFPFDASVLLPNRWSPVFEEQGLKFMEQGRERTPADWGKEKVQPLLKLMTEPVPYVACLVADGDGMGRAIEQFGSREEHFEFSTQLAKFAGEARRIVQQEHRGSLVYAGGDDVLAFLPVVQALACAESLKSEFRNILGAACKSLPEQDRPKLSVGIGIGHVMEGMGDLLELGRDAEKLAKSPRLKKEGLDRNALAIVLDKRSGGRRSWRGRWPGEPVQLLARDVAALSGRDGQQPLLSTRKVYEIARTVRRFPEPRKDLRNPDQWAQVLRLEVIRSLVRTRRGESDAAALEEKDIRDKLGLALSSGSYQELHAGILSWIDRVLIAAHVADAEPGKRGVEAVA